MGVRHIQCLLIFYAQAVSFALRVNLSVAIVIMIDSESPCNQGFTTFDWDEKTRGLILSSFFWGYVITQIPSGQLCRLFGAKIVALVGIGTCSLIAIIIPISVAIGGGTTLIVLRILQGLSQGCLFPSCHALIAKWAPLSEIGRFGTLAYSGSELGTGLMFIVSGVLASSPLGWPSIFYAAGTAGIIWAILWFFFAYNSPDECPFISEEEKTLIALRPQDTDKGHQMSGEKLSTPWCKIITSVPFIALAMSHCAFNWGFWTLLTETPTYLKNILEVNIGQNAVISSLPAWVMFFFCFIVVWTSDMLRKNTNVSVEFSRKLFNSIALMTPMVGLILMSYMGKDDIHLAIGVLIITVATHACGFSGFLINHIDLSPNFAGTLMGISNCLANVMSFMGPLVVSWVVTNEKDPDQWRIVFFIASAYYLFGALMFLFFRKGRATVMELSKRKLKYPLKLCTYVCLQ